MNEPEKYKELLAKAYAEIKTVIDKYRPLIRQELGLKDVPLEQKVEESIEMKTKSGLGVLVWLSDDKGMACEPFIHDSPERILYVTSSQIMRPALDIIMKQCEKEKNPMKFIETVISALNIMGIPVGTVDQVVAQATKNLKNDTDLPVA